jgi:hypothetical protein
MPANGRNITIWDLLKKDIIEVFAGPGISEQSVGLAFSPDRRRALTVLGDHRSVTEFYLEPAADQSVETYPIAPQTTGKRMKRGVTLGGHKQDVSGWLYLDAGRKVLTRAEEMKIWDLTTAEVLRSFAASTPFTVSQRENLLVTLERTYTKSGTVVNYEIVVLEFQTGREIERIPDPGFGPRTLAISSDDRFVVMGGGYRHSANRKYVVIDSEGTIDNRALVVWDRKEKKYRRIAGIFD